MPNNTHLLLHPFKTPYNSIPFSKIDQHDLAKGLHTLIAEAKLAIEQIANNSESPSFENTIEALENNGKQLSIISGLLFNLHSAETNDIIEKTAEEISPALASLGNDIALNPQLFERVKSVYDIASSLPLDNEQQRLLTKTYKSFTRNGALLAEQQKERLRAIDQRLSILGLTFSQHVLQATNAYHLHIQHEADLAGLPPAIIKMAAAEAESRNLEGWVFTLQFPSITPFLKYADNRNLRAQIYMANAQKCLVDDANNNEAIIKEICDLRQERASILGFKHHADFVLQERMAHDTPTVMSFLEDLLEKAAPIAHSEIFQLQQFAKKDGIEKLMGYDHAYYAEKMRQQLFSFSEEELRPYFELNKTMQAAFDLATQLYNLTFIERHDIDVYHPEVKVYEVLQNNTYKALFYTDFHPRKGKRPGAWMTSFANAYKSKDDYQQPHVSIVCNFSRPIGDEPSLLTFTEVTTLFHEFGHALHGILANTQYESLAGTNVYWDFVELPSQFMENFCYEKEFLLKFATHYKTGQLIPTELIDKIIAAANYLQGYQTLRQLGFGLLDMAYHTNQLHPDTPIESFEKNTIAATLLYPNIDKTAISTSFSHIFAGGYAAGYYSYKWAEVLDADAFAYFQEEGIFNPGVGKKFMELLQAGGTTDPMELYIQFRGRKPTNEALLKRSGLVKN